MSSEALNHKPQSVGRNHWEFVSWRKPPLDWVKTNVDGASRKNPGEASAGGLIRTDQGCWVEGFSANIGKASNVAAELWAILLGIKASWNLGCKKVIVETDSQVALSLIKEAPRGSQYWNLLAEIREMIDWDWECKLEHSWREGNMCADFLAKLGRRLAPGVAVFKNPPQPLQELLGQDLSGVARPRLVRM